MLYKDQPPSEPPPPAPKQPLPAAKAEELARQLRAAVRRSRPWGKGRKVVAVVALAVVALPLAWWFWPRPEPVHVEVIAFDQLTVPGQETTVRIGTEAVDPKAESWGDQQVYWQELKPPGAQTAADDTVTLRTDKKGMATVKRPFAATPPYALVEARYLDKRSKPPWESASRGRVFVWPVKTRLVVIELTTENKSADNMAALSAALEEAQAMGWKVVYLALGPARPLGYQAERDWAHQQMAEDAKPHQLPTGPVLGRSTYFAGADLQQAREEILAGLKKQFQGHVVLVEASKDTLTAKAVGVPPASGVVLIQPGSWQDLAAVLKQVAP
jgi:hypothetical protein